MQAQKLALLKKTDSVFTEVREYAAFPLIDSPVEDPEIKFVASIRASMKKTAGPIPDLIAMKIMIEKMAKKLGANSYSVKEYSLNDSTKDLAMTLDTWLSSDRVLKTREDQRLTNIIYIFKDSYGYSRKILRFRFNQKEIDLGYREYFVCSTEAGDEIKIRKGIAGHDISVFGGMPAIVVYYLPYQLLMNKAAHFYEARGNEINWLYLCTFYSHPKTCTGCVMPPNESHAKF
jgi:hypothetical protein